MNLWIFGAGGHAKVVADIARTLGHSVVGFVDNVHPDRNHTNFFGASVFSSVEPLRYYKNCVVAVGDNLSRMRVSQELVDQNFILEVLVHPGATVSAFTPLGAGTVVCAGAIIDAGALIEMNVIINTGVIIEHDCLIEDGAHVCPGAVLGGHVSVGRASMIGMGSTVKDHVRIGANVLIGAGSLVLKDIPDGVTAYGSPCRVA